MVRWAYTQPDKVGSPFPLPFPPSLPPSPTPPPRPEKVTRQLTRLLSLHFLLFEQVAILYEADEPGQHVEVTYIQLLREVSKVANVLKSWGVKKGDCVSLSAFSLLSDLF